MADWHWDERSGRRVPTDRRAHLPRMADRLMPRLSVLVCASGVAIWAGGVVTFINGNYWGGGALIFTGGLVLIVWAGGGWRRFRAAVAEWLNGPG